MQHWRFKQAGWLGWASDAGTARMDAAPPPPPP